MKKEQSFGIVPLRTFSNKWQVLLVQLHAKSWGFPKGHADAKETSLEAAERELFEETGTTVFRYLLTEPFIENYVFTFNGQRISKTVNYFLAIVEGNVIIQESEILQAKWFELPAAFTQLTFKEGKHIIQKVTEFVKTLDMHGNPLLSLE